MMKSASVKSDSSTVAQLVEFFHRNGCMRVPNETRRAEEARSYKMGYEIRLVAKTKRELALMRRLLRSVGLKPGKPFAKTNQWCQPVYGKSAMEQFRLWIDEFD